MKEIPVLPKEIADAVDKFDSMAYFPQMSGAGRMMIIESLLRLVNTPDGRPLRNSHGILITVPPAERLRRFVEGFVRVPGGWPGIGEMEALYCRCFPPGDGVERPDTNLPGFRWEDNADGNYTPLLPPATEPEVPLLPAPEPEEVSIIETAKLTADLKLLAERKRGHA